MHRAITYLTLAFSLGMLVVGLHVFPVRADENLGILQSSSGYLNDQSFYYIVGEVQNTGNSTLTDVFVNATLYNATGGVFGEISQPTKLLHILPGKTSPFDLTLYSTFDSLKVYNYTLRVTRYTMEQDRPIGLEITSNSSFLDSNGFHIDGSIRNTGSQSTTSAEIIATFYAADGHAIGTLLNSSVPYGLLGVNQTAQFNLVLNTSKASQVDHYRLEAESYDYELVPELPLTPALLAFMVLTMIILTFRRPHRKPVQF